MTKSVLVPHGYTYREWTEKSVGNVTLWDVIYKAQAVDDFGNVYDDPNAYWTVDQMDLVWDGEGTIQFFRVNAAGVAEALGPAIKLPAPSGNMNREVHWEPGPLYDVAYTTTGGVDVDVSLKARLTRGGYARAIDVNPNP